MYTSNIIWTASSEFGTYRLCEQQRFRRACASAQSRQNLRCSLIQAVSQEEPSDRKPDLWPLWMAGHAQLKFVMTECSKTQIRLTGLIYFSGILLKLDLTEFLMSQNFSLNFWNIPHGEHDFKVNWKHGLGVSTEALITFSVNQISSQISEILLINDLFSVFQIYIPLIELIKYTVYQKHCYYFKNWDFTPSCRICWLIYFLVALSVTLLWNPWYHNKIVNFSIFWDVTVDDFFLQNFTQKWHLIISLTLL